VQSSLGFFRGHSCAFPYDCNNLRRGNVLSNKLDVGTGVPLRPIKLYPLRNLCRCTRVYFLFITPLEQHIMNTHIKETHIRNIHNKSIHNKKKPTNMRSTMPQTRLSKSNIYEKKTANCEKMA